MCSSDRGYDARECNIFCVKVRRLPVCKKIQGYYNFEFSFISILFSVSPFDLVTFSLEFTPRLLILYNIFITIIYYNFSYYSFFLL